MSRAHGLASLCWAGVLVTLPWIGLETARPLLGRDLGTGVPPAYLLLAGAVALTLVAGAAGAGAGGLGWRRRDLALALLALAAVAVSAAGLAARPAPAPAAERWARYGRQAAQLALMLVFALWAAAWTRGPRRWALTRRLLAWGLLFQVAYAALQAVHFRGGVPWFALPERWFTSNPAILSGSEQLYLGGGFLDVPRLRGTACEPLYLGSYLLLALPAMLLPGRGRTEKVALSAGAILLLATWARGAWLGAVAAAIAGALLWRAARLPRRRLRRTRRLGLAVAVVGLAAVVAVAIAPDLAALPVRRLLQSLDRQDWSNLTRLYSMGAAWQAFRLSPLVGIGWGQFAYHFPLLTDPMGLQSQFTWPVVNNFPLEILCETGLVGGGALALALLLLGRDLGGALRRPGVPDEGRRRLVLLAAANLGIWAQLLTFSQYNLPHLWVAGGLLLAALAEARRPAPRVAGAGTGAPSPAVAGTAGGGGA